MVRGIPQNVLSTASRARSAISHSRANSPKPGKANANVTFDHHNIPKVTFAFPGCGMFAGTAHSQCVREPHILCDSRDQLHRAHRAIQRANFSITSLQGADLHRPRLKRGAQIPVHNTQYTHTHTHTHTRVDWVSLTWLPLVTTSSSCSASGLR